MNNQLDDKYNTSCLLALEEGNIHQLLNNEEQELSSGLRRTRSEPLLPKNESSAPPSRSLSTTEMSSMTRLNADDISSLFEFKTQLMSVMPTPLLRRYSGENLKPSPKLFMCSICMENHPDGDGFTLKDCIAQHRFCVESMKMNLTSRIATGSVLSLRCPCYGRNNCSALFKEEEVDQLVDKASFVQYSRLLELKTNPSARECPSCLKFTSSGSEEKPEIVCSGCGTKFCYMHNDAHPHSTCQEYTKSTEKVDMRSLATVKTISQTCPKCKAPTQKISGCNHMTCQYCEADWCWLCGKEFNSNEDHYGGMSPCSGKLFSSGPSLAQLWPFPCLRWGCFRFLGQFIHGLYIVSVASIFIALCWATLPISIACLPFILLSLHIRKSSNFRLIIYPGVYIATRLFILVLLVINLVYIPVPIVILLSRVVCYKFRNDPYDVQPQNFFPWDDLAEDIIIKLWFLPVVIVQEFMSENYGEFN